MGVNLLDLGKEMKFLFVENVVLKIYLPYKQHKSVNKWEIKNILK